MCEDGDVDHFCSSRGAGRRLCFSFATEIVQFLCFLNLAISRGCTDCLCRTLSETMSVSSRRGSYVHRRANIMYIYMLLNVIFSFSFE